MKITKKELTRLLEQSVAKYLNREEATVFAGETIRAHLTWSSRINVIKEHVEDIETWGDSQGNEVKVLKDQKASLLLDLNKRAPSLKIKYIQDELVNRAKEFGISIVSFVNQGGFHTLDFWTRGIAERNCIGLCFYNSGPADVVPFGGTEGALGINPLSYSIPTTSLPIVADMSASEIPFMELMRAHKASEQVTSNSIVNKHGEPTVDPQDAMWGDEKYGLLSIGGGHKGYALNFLFEILTSAMIGSRMSIDQTRPYVASEHGATFLAIDIEKFVDVSDFKQSIEKLSGTIRNQKPAKGYSNVRVPGDRGNACLSNSQENIEIDSESYGKLMKMI